METSSDQKLTTEEMLRQMTDEHDEDELELVQESFEDAAERFIGAQERFKSASENNKDYRQDRLNEAEEAFKAARAEFVPLKNKIMKRKRNSALLQALDALPADKTQLIFTQVQNLLKEHEASKKIRPTSPPAEESQSSVTVSETATIIEVSA